MYFSSQRALQKARGGLHEEPLADINTHIHKLSSVLESLVVDLLNQRAHMHAKARGTTSTGVKVRLLCHCRCMVSVSSMKTSPLVPTASTECIFPIENSEAAC